MFRAYDAQRERLVAVKVFQLDLPPDRAHWMVAEFERLISLAVSHPSLVSPVTTGLAEVSPYLAMDYVAADSLDLAVRERGPSPPADVLRMAQDLAGALDAAAAAEVFHGALHPRDVLVSSDETRVTGLGVAHALEEAGAAVPLRRPYTAPERAAERPWDRRADVFSLAAIVFEALWGRRIVGLGSRAVDDLPPIAEGNLDRLRRVFAEALAGNPADRTPTAGHFTEGLRHALGDPVLVSPDAAPRRPAKKSRPPVEQPPAAAAHLAADDDLPLTNAAEPALQLDEPPLADVELHRVAADHVSPHREETPPGEIPLVSATATSDRGHEHETRAPARTEALPAAESAPPIHTGAAPGPLFGSSPRAEAASHALDDLTLLERSRSAVWPLALALVIGVAIGFAGGYAFSLRERPGVQGAAVGGTSGTEFTEGTIAAPRPPPATAMAQLPPSPAQTPATSSLSNAGRPAAARDVAPAASERIGRLLVRSTPAGARVVVDGRDVGRTPATVYDLAAGAHRVRVSRDGFVTDERQVVVTPSRPAHAIIVALARGRGGESPRPSPAAQAGSGNGALMVDSRPAGAKVFLDGRLIGTTPLLLPDVPSGEHAIRMERDGYRRWAASAKIAAGEQSRVTASLER